jgi:hypothetical protein
LYVGAKGVVIAPPFGARVYPYKPFSMAVQKSFGSFQCAINFRAFAHDYSLFIHSSMDGHVNMCIQSSSGALHMQQDFFPP